MTRSMSPAAVVHRKVGADTKAGADVKGGIATQPKPLDAQKKDGFWEGFAGTVGGSFFRTPHWVDLQKAPGTTNQQMVDNFNWKGYLNTSVIFFSPNLVWITIALVDYFVFPYDIDAQKVFTVKWFAFRLFANSTLTFGYVSFWHVTLYFLNWGTRPFNPTREYRWSRVAHNVFYNVCAVLQWTVWEALFVYCFATGRLPYISDEESFGSCAGVGVFALTCVFVAVWRDLHFYFCHRIIHIKFLFKYVHSLHHRNTDIEPFSGLCMHPIEHLLYFACAGPALYMKASPFLLMWFGIHLLVSPAASHSGFEDHFQSDQYHYLHHRFFECNYGTAGVPYDKWFGTFRDSLDVKASKSYQGAHVMSADDKTGSTAAAIADAKATLVGLPTWDQLVFNIVSYVALPALVSSAAGLGPAPKESLGLLGHPRVVALLMAGGPAILGIAMLAATAPRPFARPALTFFYPFHKERLFGAFGINVLISLSVTVLPVYHMVYMLLSEPGQAVYFYLWA